MIQKKFLVLYDEDQTAQLLGYPLPLSPLEFDILFRIAASTLIEPEALVERLHHAIPLSTLSVHIHNINKKAFDISGRKLIAHVCDGYSLYLQM